MLKNSFSLFLALFILQGAISAQNPPSEVVNKTQNLIHPGDLIDVDFLGSFENDWRGTLTPEGFLNGLDLAEEPIFALCRSQEEVAEKIVQAYSKLLREPKVVVKIIDRSNRPLSTIYGAVKTEQRFQIKRPVFLNELIVMAGGFTDKASGEIQIFRPPELNCAEKNVKPDSPNDGSQRERFVAASQTDESNYIKVKISDILKGVSNPQILSGDIITVLESEPIYVIGGVTTPQKISSRAQITLTRAIAASGGLTKDADGKNVTIFRREAGETKIIETEYEKIVSGQVEDIPLKAFDIIEVATKGRGKSKFPPVVETVSVGGKSSPDLPLRIID